MTAIGLDGAIGAFTGHDNTAARGDRSRPGLVVAGNLLADPAVLDAMMAAFDTARGPLPARLMAALRAAEQAGSDSRGLLSAALHVVNRTRPPLTLRIDHDAAPLDRLQALYDSATTGDYADWTRTVPVLDDPTRR